MKNRTHKLNIIERVEQLRSKGIYDPFMEKMARMFKKYREQKQLNEKN
jgi:hypothetical protein